MDHQREPRLPFRPAPGQRGQQVGQARATHVQVHEHQPAPGSDQHGEHQLLLHQTGEGVVHVHLFINQILVPRVSVNTLPVVLQGWQPLSDMGKRKTMSNMA